MDRENHKSTLMGILNQNSRNALKDGEPHHSGQGGAGSVRPLRTRPISLPGLAGLDGHGITPGDVQRNTALQKKACIRSLQQSVLAMKIYTGAERLAESRPNPVDHYAKHGD